MPVWYCVYFIQSRCQRVNVIEINTMVIVQGRYITGVINYLKPRCQLRTNETSDISSYFIKKYLNTQQKIIPDLTAIFNSRLNGKCVRYIFSSNIVQHDTVNQFSCQQTQHLIHYNLFTSCQRKYILHNFIICSPYTLITSLFIIVETCVLIWNIYWVNEQLMCIILTALDRSVPKYLLFLILSF